MNISGLKKILPAAAVVIGLGAAGSALATAGKADGAFTEAQRGEVENIISEYLMDNPKLVIDAIENYRRQQQEEMARQAEEGVKQLDEKLAEQDWPVYGAEDPAVRIVEFFDYNCGYCKRALSDVEQILENNDDVEVVFIELPILSESSALAARWSLAASMVAPDKYFGYHKAIMNHSGPKTEQSLADLADEEGIDSAKVAEKADSREVADLIAEGRQLAQLLGVRGTPGFVIGEEIARGYMGYEAMQDVVDTMRQE